MELLKLVLVNNPEHNKAGDFALVKHQLALKTDQTTNFTYAGIGLYSPKLLANPTEGNQFPEVFSIVPHIKAAIATLQAGAQLHAGLWHDVGTFDRLDALPNASDLY